MDVAGTGSYPSQFVLERGAFREEWVGRAETVEMNVVINGKSTLCMTAPTESEHAALYRTNSMFYHTVFPFQVIPFPFQISSEIVGNRESLSNGFQLERTKRNRSIHSRALVGVGGSGRLFEQGTQLIHAFTFVTKVPEMLAAAKAVNITP